MNNADLRLGVIVVVVVGVVVRLNQNFIFTRMCLSSQVLSSYLLFPLIPLRSTALDAFEARGYPTLQFLLLPKKLFLSRSPHFPSEVLCRIFHPKCRESRVKSS